MPALAMPNGVATRAGRRLPDPNKIHAQTALRDRHRIHISAEFHHSPFVALANSNRLQNIVYVTGGRIARRARSNTGERALSGICTIR